jgi:hypothetical protein
MEIRPVRRDKAAALRELRLRAPGDAPHEDFASLESERRPPLSYWEEWATSPRVRPSPACRRRRNPALWVRAHDTRGRARRGPGGPGTGYGIVSGFAGLPET